MVDAWLMYKQCTYTHEIQKDFYSYFAEELIDNIYDTAGTQASRRSRGDMYGAPSRNDTAIVAENGMLRSGAAIYLLRKCEK